MGFWRFLITEFEGRPSRAITDRGCILLSSSAFLGETERTIPWRRPANMTVGSAGGVKEAPRRRRGCLDAGEHPTRLEQWTGWLAQLGATSAWVSSRSTSLWKTASNSGL